MKVDASVLDRLDRDLTFASYAISNIGVQILNICGELGIEEETKPQEEAANDIHAVLHCLSSLIQHTAHTVGEFRDWAKQNDFRATMGEVSIQGKTYQITGIPGK